MRKILIPVLCAALLAPPAAASDLDALFRRAANDVAPSRPAADDAGDGGAKKDVSKSKSFLLSALVPGLGQRANGSTLRSRAFFVAEAVIWASFIVFKTQEHLRTDDFEEYAVAYAGLGNGNRDFEFYRILTIYDNSDQYNESVRIEARAIYPDDRDAQRRYFEENGFGSDRAFRWRENQNRLDYRLIRNDAVNSGRRADYALVAAVVNRAVSAVEAARTAGHLQKVAAVAERLRVAASGEGEPASLHVGVAATF